MSDLVWNPEWDTGVELIDEQHRQLLAQFDRLLAAVRVKGQVQQLGSLVGFLADYVELHFRSEESLMAEVGFPDLARHQVLHNEMRARVEAVREDFAQSPGIVTLELLEFLTHWLINHISVEDRRLAQHIRSLPTG